MREATTAYVDRLRRLFVPLLFAAFALGALFPEAGQIIRHTHLDAAGKISVPMLMLAVLLLNAGMGLGTCDLPRIAARPAAYLGGILAACLVPIACVLLLAWSFAAASPVNATAAGVLTGLALVAAMPVANSSVGWAQNAKGNLGYALALVIGSTLLSPLFAPVALSAADVVHGGSADSAYGGLASASGFMILWVLLPTAIGLGLRAIIGAARSETLRPVLRGISAATLLALNYVNASLALPGMMHVEQAPAVAIIIVLVAAMCGITFLLAWRLAMALHADADSRASLVFGLGMKNTGAALVLLAATALTAQPLAMTTVIVYTLVQHIAAAIASAAMRRGVA